MRIIKIYNYTLKEIYEVEPYSNNESFANLLTSMGIVFTPEEDSLIEDLWKKVINKYYEGICFSSYGTEASDIDMYIKKKAWIVKFLNMYESTKDKYETLINLFNAKKDKLFAEVSSSSENEVFFNDTPQTEGGVFKGTDYTSNYTKTTNTNKSELQTPIQRLKEIQEALLSYWGRWLAIFERLFIEEED